MTQRTSSPAAVPARGLDAGAETERDLLPAGRGRKPSLSHTGAIGFAVAGFTFWVFTDTSIKLVGQSRLPVYEMVAFLGLFMAFFSGLVTAAAGFGMMLFHAAPLTPRLTAGLVAMGMFCAAGTLCFYIAVKHTSAANVSQYHYTQLLTGTLLAYLIWHQTPGLPVILGGCLILGSGIYIAMSAHDLAPLSEGN